MFQCRDLFNLPSFSNAKLLCGDEGLNNIIRWAYKAESQDIKRWVKGHELLIISGAIIDKKDFDLSNLLLQAIELNLSGAVILVGENYITSLPKAIIKKCNEKNFPIFLINWNTPLINIFEELGHAIVLSSGLNQLKDGFIGNIIFGNNFNKEILYLKASELSYPLDGRQNIFLINLSDSEQNTSEDSLNEFQISQLKEQISILFKKQNLHMIVSSYGTNIVGIFTDFQDRNNSSVYKSTIKEIMTNFINSLSKSYPYININIGIGRSYSDTSEISKSFDEASKCISICSKLHHKNEILFFEDLGILKLFSEIENTDKLKSYKNDILKPLIDHDKKSNGCLLQTLKVYAESDFNILSASKEMGIHRNTIKYRIERIEKILGIKLDNSFTKLNVYNALLIHMFF